MADPIEITIKEWMKLPTTLEAVELYKKHDMLPESFTFDGFEINQSIRAFELYKDCDDAQCNPSTVAEINKMYAFGSAGDNADRRVLRCITNTILSLMVKAISTKVEGCSIGDGKLVIQERRPIIIEDDLDFGFDKRRALYWRGSIFRIGETWQIQS